MANNDFDFAVFDTEDDSKELLAVGKSGFDKRVTQIAAITAAGAHYYNKGNVEAFKDHIRKSDKTFWYALNIQYDLGNLFGDSLDSFDVTMVDGRMIKAVWGNKVFVDVFNIWPMSVKRLGEAFGLRKLETNSMSTDKAYVYRDCEIIRAAMLFAWEWCEHLGIDHLPPTLGGLCVKLWRHWGGENCHDSSLMSREAIFGGRVELFKICNWRLWNANNQRLVYDIFNQENGKNLDDLSGNRTKDSAWLDINSLYPAVMSKGIFPGPLEDCGKKLPAHGIARVTMKQPETDIAVLPYRNDDGRIVYPWGKFTGVWTLAEIRHAEANGASIDKVFECYGTDEGCQPYGAFVNNLYKARLASKSEAEKLFFKLLMNNLYGRLGTTGKIGRSVWQTEKNRLDGVPYGEKVLVTYQMPLSEETNWSHAAYVTAYGRIALHEHLKVIGGEQMIYCDTDSVIFDCPKKKLPCAVGNDLGEMKLVSWESNCFAFAPKLYKAGNVYKAKGVKKDKARDYLIKGHAEFDLPFKFREAVSFFDGTDRHGKERLPNTRKLSVWRPVQKFNRVRYDRKKLIGNRFYPCKVIS